MWSVILDFEVKPEHIPLCMIAAKISRECHSPKQDNRIDIAGYAETLEMVHRHKEATDVEEKEEDQS